MSDELAFPEEGLSTLGAQFSKAAMEKVTDAVRKLLKEGWSEAKIVKKMREELRGFRPFMIQRLFDRAAGRKIEDDIPAADVVGEKILKEGTIEVELARAPKDVESDCLVQFRGGDWYVARVRGKSYALKRLR